MIEAAEGCHHFLQGVLAGVSERRMSEIVRQRQGLAQILIETKRAANRTRDLRNFEAMGQASPEEIALVIDENLGLVFEPAERGGMNDPVAVALEGTAGLAFRFRMQPATAFVGTAGIGLERRPLDRARVIDGVVGHAPKLGHRR